MQQASCHCGAICLQLASHPEEVFECNCSICQKLGVLWAYYHCDDVEVTQGAGTTNQYIWNDKILAFHSCPSCGCTTHWQATDPNFREKMGVNARLIDGISPANTKVFHIGFGEPDWHWTNGTKEESV